MKYIDNIKAIQQRTGVSGSQINKARDLYFTRCQQMDDTNDGKTEPACDIATSTVYTNNQEDSSHQLHLTTTSIHRIDDDTVITETSTPSNTSATKEE